MVYIITLNYNYIYITKSFLPPKKLKSASNEKNPTFLSRRNGKASLLSSPSLWIRGFNRKETIPHFLGSTYTVKTALV